MVLQRWDPFKELRQMDDIKVVYSSTPDLVGDILFLLGICLLRMSTRIPHQSTGKITFLSRVTLAIID